MNSIPVYMLRFQAKMSSVNMLLLTRMNNLQTIEFVKMFSGKIRR